MPKWQEACTRAPKSFAPQVLCAKSCEQKKNKKHGVRKCFNIKDITLDVTTWLCYNIRLESIDHPLMLSI